MKNTVDRANKKRHYLLPFIVLFIVIALVLVACGDQTSSSDNATTNTATLTANPTSSNTQPTQATPANTVTTRKVTGKATTLGAGSFTGSKDVVDGLYNVTTTSGQSGNFVVNGTDFYNEILPVVCCFGKSFLVLGIYSEQCELSSALFDGFIRRRNPEATNYRYDISRLNRALSSRTILSRSLHF